MLVTDELVTEMTGHFRGMYGIYLVLIQKIRKIMTCTNRLGLGVTRILTQESPKISSYTSMTQSGFNFEGVNLLM